MPVTFGAVGDIISVCLLVKDVVEALDKTRGSKAEYQSLTRELWILDRTLLEIEMFSRTHGGGATPEMEALCETARQAVERCKGLVSEFLKSIKKYQRTFGESSKPNVIKEVAMKVRWRSMEHDSVEKFRVEIAGTSASLQMLLATASVKLMDVKEKSIKDVISDVQQQNESNATKQDATLVIINDRLEENNRLINAGNAVANKIKDTLRLDWLRQLGNEMKSYMRRIIAINIATYHAVVSIQAVLPGRLERSLIEEPFILEDAIGRVAPVHLQFVTSWEAFNAVLEIRFKDIQGFEKVKERQYGLQEKATGREIDQSRNWQRAFLPGQRIDMSFIFDSAGTTPENNRKTTCPGCFHSSDNVADVDIQCAYCGMWFRRITIIEDMDPPPQVPVPRPWNPQSEFGKPGFAGMILGPPRPGKRKVRPSEIEEIDMREFKRVRLIAKQQRIRHHRFGNIATTRAMTFADVSSKISSEPIMLNNPSTLEWNSLPSGPYRAPRDNNDAEDRDMIDVTEAELEDVRREELVKKLTSGGTAAGQVTLSVSLSSTRDDENAHNISSQATNEHIDTNATILSGGKSSRETRATQDHPPYFLFLSVPRSEEVSLENVQSAFGISATATTQPYDESKHSKAEYTCMLDLGFSFKIGGLWIPLGVICGDDTMHLWDSPLTDGDMRGFSNPDKDWNVAIWAEFVFQTSISLVLSRYSVYQAWRLWDFLRRLETKRKRVVKRTILHMSQKREGNTYDPDTEKLSESELKDCKFIVHVHYTYWRMKTFVRNIMTSPCLEPVKNREDLYWRQVIRAILQWTKTTFHLQPV